MHADRTPDEVYRKLVSTNATLLQELHAKRRKLGYLRLLTGAVIIGFVYYLFFNRSPVVWVGAFAAIAVFLYLISGDTDNDERIAAAERLLQINNEELAVLRGQFHHREDGAKFLPAVHPYAGDIDLFGNASLYQYMNRCTSEQSRKRLASILLELLPKEEILTKQEAAQKLATSVEWRQDLQSAGLANPLTFATEKKLRFWLNMDTPFQEKYWQYLPHAFTVLTFTATALYVFDVVNSSLYTLFVIVFFAIAKPISAKINSTYLALSQIGAEVNTIEQQLHIVEDIPIATHLFGSGIQAMEQTGSKSIKKLKGILERFDYRLNVFVFIFLNTYLLWDLRQMVSLNKWKTEHQSSVVGWFALLSEMEVVNTLATLTFNHPSWIFPTISDDHFHLSATNLGHPLISITKRVDNSFATNGTAQISVITGSNMAGKSTFLRSLGINLVLAQIGAPVCAKAFTFSPAHLLTSMRIADNLAENTSTFYAELKKLKEIIDQVKQHKKVFILLDEILRGTNSLDRHTGSEALIKQFIKEQAVAVIATHDVELAALEKEFSNAITNYHFDVQVEGEELYFDYKLKRGICQSMNASLLMKKIGIDM